MKIECTDKKTFQLITEGQTKGKLIYKKLFSINAEIELPESELYEIKSSGFFDTDIIVSKNELKIALLKLNLKGQIVLSFTNGNEYIVTTKGVGVFRNRYVVENREKEELIQFDPHFNWSKLEYNYDVTFNKRESDLLLVMIGVFAANYHMAVIMS
ncbi:hypothetical protein OOZ15_03570 [Galbibacter sp. EGI 63066]|uniref:hypothetical protein n=1 Tax=Galbibacter sp. EGI 63066 TaxID=2993559 RepID=UPI0022490DD2|nr:hypothetical protein [Galbibacter sp. EGI 63066]MCX2679010.1 hypothetical protein [Galbibacter sp. EGI 63066]